MLLESVSVLCVAMGLIATLAMLLGVFWRSGRFTLSPHAVRLRFGTWLGMALEFQLGADIVATTVNPTLQSLTELAILAAVRTFLNYFLQKELEAGERLAAERSEGVAAAGSPRSENP
ncbi:MAG: DUF1622 domain-containing protein [Desulfobaccales bacterium]